MIEKKRTEVIRFLHDLAAKGVTETAKRSAEIVQQFFVFTLESGVIESNPRTGLTRSLPSKPVKSFTNIKDPEGLGRMLYRIDRLDSVMTRSAL